MITTANYYSKLINVRYQFIHKNFNFFEIKLTSLETTKYYKVQYNSKYIESISESHD